MTFTVFSIIQDQSILVNEQLNKPLISLNQWNYIFNLTIFNYFYEHDFLLFIENNNLFFNSIDRHKNLTHLFTFSENHTLTLIDKFFFIYDNNFLHNNSILNAFNIINKLIQLNFNLPLFSKNFILYDNFFTFYPYFSPEFNFKFNIYPVLEHFNMYFFLENIKTNNTIYFKLCDNFKLFFTNELPNWEIITNELFTEIFDVIQPKTSQNLKSILELDDLLIFDNLTNITSLYHYSIPNTKLAYPEPFIASASFMHSDLWFVHILIYQYWLWFIFIFLIIFFFLTFVSVVRWCNMRTRPRRETRGVSRSKCGDLITACVPVSWATSIIVNESTDAIDFYDGFGTTELVIGIRAYQWGWEYYYPKDIDLNYNIKKNYSTFIGNSVKYNTTSSINLNKNNLWKFYQNKSSDQSILPAHFLMFSLDNYKILNFFNFSDIGTNVLNESIAFKKTKTFFKIFPTNSFYQFSDYNFQYKKFFMLYNNDMTFFDSQSYLIKRNHNYLSLNSNNNGHFTFLNHKNFFKFLSYNFETKIQNEKTNNTFNANLNENIKNFKLFTIYFTKFFQKLNKISFLNIFEKNQIYPHLLFILNNDSDKKKTIYTMFKNLTLLKNNNNIINLELKNINFSNNNCFIQKNTHFNKNFEYKKYSSFSSNQSFATNMKNIRSFINTPAALANTQFSSKFNTTFNYLNTTNTTNTINSLFFFNLNSTNWIDLSLFSRLINNKIYFDFPISPIVANNALSILIEYDNSKNSTINNTSTLFQNKEDNIPNSFFSTYWNFYWNNSMSDIRFINDLTYFQNYKTCYLPLFNFSYDYDFRNWQNMELLEDSFWETSFSNYIYEEYIENFADFAASSHLIKPIENFNDNKFDIYQNNEFFENFIFMKNNNYFYNLIPYFDENLINSSLLHLENFSLISLINNILIDDTYETMKFFKNVNNLSYKNYLNNTTNFFLPLNYSIVLNMFRSDFDDTNWYIDKQNYFNNKFNNNIFEKFFDFNKNIITHNNLNVNLLNDKRFDNFFNLRNTTKNSMVTYNALQKVFRTRLDEGRSNTRLLDFTNFYSKQPYLSSLRTSYENLLGKNKNSFYKINFYKTNFYTNFNLDYNSLLTVNYYTYDFPFLLAAKSDASRHIWFDWFSKWGFYEVQPSSSARYAIHGLPHFNKYFNFTSSQNEILNETESYFLRLNKARKNYLPGWTYTPYFYAKNNYWYKNNLNFNTFQNQNNKINGIICILNNAIWFDTIINKNNTIVFNFLPSNSNVNSYTKSLWKPLQNSASYYFNISALTDLLTKREFLYRQLFVSNKNLINLPEYVINSPNNSLIKEIKTMFLYIDPILANNEYSRDFYCHSLNFFNFNTIKIILDLNPLLTNFSELIFFYLFNNNNNNNFTNNYELFKNQYRPLRKGINNMLRLHATGAIAMPIEIRLQILASSKDVIHSWAIPSAGIKIDCVPGYSSHKVMIFLVSGIFWGQCMEICGRYHHWMPIVVYFMKRDLFFLWCTHFVFISSNNSNSLNDKQFINHSKLVSYDKNSWLNELLN